MDGKTEAAVEHAMKSVYHDPDSKYRLGKKYSRIIKEYLEPNEWIAIGARQSRLVSLSPSILLATNKKIILGNPSFWRLYTGHVVFSASTIQFIPYSIIMGISFTRGRYLSTINIKTLGRGTIKIGSLKTEEAKLLLSFIEDVVEHISSQSPQEKP